MTPLSIVTTSVLFMKKRAGILVISYELYNLRPMPRRAIISKDKLSSWELTPGFMDT